MPGSRGRVKNNDCHSQYERIYFEETSKLERELAMVASTAEAEDNFIFGVNSFGRRIRLVDVGACAQTHQRPTEDYIRN